MSIYDSLFLLWNGSKREHIDFIAKWNTCHPTIKFDHKYSRNRMEFLDTTVYKNKVQNKLQFSNYEQCYIVNQQTGRIFNFINLLTENHW